MVFEQLRYFVLICENGSFLRAAEKAYISRQALSKSIASLETELGVELLKRSAKGVALSEMGQFVYQQARPLVMEMEQFQIDLTKKIHADTGVFKLNIFPSSMYLFSVERLKEAISSPISPKMALEIYEYDSPADEEKVTSGELDASLMVGYIGRTGLNSIPIKEYKRVALVSRQNPLSEKKIISLDDLRHEKLALCMNRRDYDHFTYLCKQKGFTPVGRHIGETNFMYELCNEYGFTGLNLDFVADNLISKYENLVAVTFSDPDFPSVVSLVFSKNTEDMPKIKSLALSIQNCMTR